MYLRAASCKFISVCCIHKSCCSFVSQHSAQISLNMKSRSSGQDDTGQQGGVYMTGGHVDLYLVAEQSE